MTLPVPDPHEALNDERRLGKRRWQEQRFHQRRWHRLRFDDFDDNDRGHISQPDKPSGEGRQSSRRFRAIGERPQ